MRIIGGHDYYDGVAPFDADNERVFLRDRREMKFDRRLYDFPLEQHRTKTGWNVEVAGLEVVFCGVVHRGIQVEMHRTNSVGYPERKKPVVYWSADRFRDFLNTHALTFAERPKYRWGRDDEKVYAQDIDGYFATEQAPPALFARLLADKVLVAIAPVAHRFVQKDAPWVVNGDGLKDISFGAAVEPWAAYQELEMFLGTILVGDEDRMVKVSDETKLRKYGFDAWSFKNPVHRAKPRGRTA